jgi:hypothetical protein
MNRFQVFHPDGIDRNTGMLGQIDSAPIELGKMWRLTVSLAELQEV